MWILKNHLIYRVSLSFPEYEYEAALVEYHGDIDEAIIQRIVSNPIHVYKLIKEMELFSSKVGPILTANSTLNGSHSKH